MKKSTITNSQLLELIENKKLNAQQICEKSGISISAKKLDTLNAPMISAPSFRLT
jgi:hypothetical protein